MATKRINLLPPEERAKARRERGLTWTIVALLVLAAVLGMVYFWENAKVSDKESERDQLEADIAAVQVQMAELQPYKALQTKRTEMTKTAKALDDARVPWSTIFEEISLVIPENVRLQSLTCTVPAAMLPGGAAETATGELAADVTFTGQTYQHKDVAEFMTRLGLIPQLTNIQLASSTTAAAATGTTTTTATTQELTTFTVTASLRRYVTAPPTTKAAGE
ncbi:MAG TPA: PilN domain-containing protein [Thermoleophilia bacterium]|nr:PilN domain-containing protein [Thermoleophilia bacterium]HQG03955.1 PilN domain-containing protein [Thermoleophilia bacterium]